MFTKDMIITDNDYGGYFKVIGFASSSGRRTVIVENIKCGQRHVYTEADMVECNWFREVPQSVILIKEI